MDTSMIPERTLSSLKRYAEEHCPTGDFLYAVLTNDLFGAFGRADRENTFAMQDICAFIYNEIPSACWGSKEIVRKWLERKEGDQNGNT